MHAYTPRSTVCGLWIAKFKKTKKKKKKKKKRVIVSQIGQSYSYRSQFHIKKKKKKKMDAKLVSFIYNL